MIEIRPEKVILNLTSACNLNCRMCTQTHSAGPGTTLPLDLVKKVIADMERYNPKIVLFGGEPTLHPEFDDILDCLAESKITTVEVCTNGYNMRRYIRKCFIHGIHLNISLDGNEREHNHIRRNPQSFSRVVDVLGEIRNLRKTLVFSNRFTFAINSVIIPPWNEGLLAFVDWVMQFNPCRVVLQHLQFMGDDTYHEMEEIWRDDLKSKFTCELKLPETVEFGERFIDDMLALYDGVMKRNWSDAGIELFPNIERFEIGNYYTRTGKMMRAGRVCSRPWLQPTVLPNGDVTICLDHVIGNVNEGSLESVWRSDAAELFRTVLRKRLFFPFCQFCCNFYGECNLIFRDIVRSKNGSWLALPPGGQKVACGARGFLLLDRERRYGKHVGEVPAYARAVSNPIEAWMAMRDNVYLGTFELFEEKG